MDDSRLNPVGRSIADQRDRDRRIKEAYDLTQIIIGKSERLGSKPPPYDFRELIGKGAYGRVYKCLEKKTNNLVAVKIIDIDDQDWEQGWTLTTGREKNIEDVQKEVSILRQLKDNNAKNVNLIHDAFDWHGQLWIVADYCTGGSVRTLMRPFEKNGRPIGLPEHFIIPIARELAIAVKSMHDLDILHRDIKCANVYITETGEIQLGDFGIVGVLGHDTEKRKTVVGTPHWMPREVVKHLDEKETEEGYGYEVDIWSYGCTIFEMATGSPPYPTTSVAFLPEMLEKAPPRLEGEDYSPELRDLVAFCLDPDKNARPSASAVLNHHYLKDTSRIYPTRNLVRLIERFKIWEHGGGSRASLWMAGPADPRQSTEDDGESGNSDDGDDGEEWNFSTSENFDEELGRRLSQMPTGTAFDDWNFDSPSSSGLPSLQTKNLSVAERIKQEHIDKAAGRGEFLLNKVFDTNDPDGYQLPKPPESPKVPQVAAPSDLPLRAYGSSASSRESVVEMLDLDDAMTPAGTSSLEMRMAAINEETIRPAGRYPRIDDDDDDNYQYGQHDSTDRRATMEWNFATAAPRVQRETRDWKFETAERISSIAPSQAVRTRPETMAWSFETAGPATLDEAEQSFDSTPAGSDRALPPGFRPQLMHTATEPIGHFRGLSHDSDTAASSPNRDSVTSLIDLDAGSAERARVGNEILRPGTASSHMTDATSGNPFDLEDDPEQVEVDRNRFSYHKPYASEGGMIKRLSHKTMPMHARGASLSSTEPDIEPSRPTTSAYRPLPSNTSQQDLSFSTLEQGLGLTPVEAENNQWPSFSSYETFESSPQYLATPGDEQRLPRLGDSLADDRMRTNGVTMPLRQREPSAEPPRPEIEFPILQAPHPDALTDMADDQFLEDELSRMLDDCSYALTSVSRALQQHASLDTEDDGISSEIDSGFNSQQQDTEDEDVDHLTARRKPRKLEMRSPASRV
ncbi:Putative serine/threonine-protein kinase, active [Septoria linicola]|uniref:non-specific serine/threonine protein kinase n=1 Tax=Septoria linicola TaxID=215465 RepID=A0A9Q9EMF6_9PEZI|nr:putative serine/threonine-protein kinase, active [Septoria linicola]USW54393.1 Putative serine/threonine-protein kinase, active [Septoria linicola]